MKSEPLEVVEGDEIEDVRKEAAALKEERDAQGAETGDDHDDEG